MALEYKDQRVGVFIDVQNLYHSARNIYNARVNFDELLKDVLRERKLIRSFAYVVRTKTGEEQPFFEALVKLGFETRIRDLQEFAGGQKKADWDVGIVIDAVRVAPSVDVVILISGDGDFIPLVEYLRNQGKRVEVMAFKQSASSKLIEAADKFIDIGEDPKHLLLLSPQKPRRRLQKI